MVGSEPVVVGATAFADAEVEGTFVILNEGSRCMQTTDEEIANTPFRPQSTFKIAHTLIGLETGAIAGAEHRWLWDGTPRPLPAWEQDLDLAGALRVSCVPCFQEVARTIGRGPMEHYLRDFDYGNRDVSGPVDQFWLTGNLRITPREQATFVLRSLSGELPVRPEYLELLWRSLELERGPGSRLYGKTGLGRQDGRAIGWLVGYVASNGTRSAFATFLRSLAGEDVESALQRLIPLRESLTRELLVAGGHIPEGLSGNVVESGQR